MAGLSRGKKRKWKEGGMLSPQRPAGEEAHQAIMSCITCGSRVIVFTCGIARVPACDAAHTTIIVIIDLLPLPHPSLAKHPYLQRSNLLVHTRHDNVCLAVLTPLSVPPQS